MAFFSMLSSRKVHKLKLTNSFSELKKAAHDLQVGQNLEGPNADTLIQEFEKQFSVSLGANQQAVIFPHARVGIHYILKAYDFEAKSEVLMTPLTIADMVNSIHSAGLVPKFVDIDLKSLNFDLDELELSITPKTRAILVTYIAGVIPEMDKLMVLAKRHGLKVIEDCSQAVHASYAGQKIGTFGDAAVFSLTNFKVVASLFGGMILTKDMELVQKLRSYYKTETLEPDPKILISHCKKNMLYHVLFSRYVFSYATYFLVLLLEYVAPQVTYKLYSGNIKVILGDFKNRLLSKFPDNYLRRFTGPQASLGMASLRRSDREAKSRNSNGELLRRELQGLKYVMVPEQKPNGFNAYWRFPLLTNSVDELKKRLLLNGIDSSKTFLTLCSQEPGFEPYHVVTPRASLFKKCALILEIDEELSRTDILALAKIIRNFFAQHPQEDLFEIPSL